MIAPLSDTKRSVKWLTLGRIVWIVLAVGYLAIWLASLPEFYARVSTLTIEPFRLGERVLFDNTIALREAAERGVSLEASAVYGIVLDLFTSVFYYLVAGIILWRATNGFGWFTAFVLLLMGVQSFPRAIGVATPFAGALLLIELPGYLAWPLWLLWLYLFPNGAPVPRWSRFPVFMLFALFMLLQIVLLGAIFGILPVQLDTVVATLSPLLVLPIFGCVLFAQIYRYGRVSTLTERQQTKWFLFGLGVFFLGLLVFVVAPDLIRSSVVTQNLFAIVSLIFPVAVAVAVLRYRLFDIDVIIRKTLVYSVLTALLALIYFGGVVLVQQLTRSITASSDLAIAVSTLIIAALFFPLRRRVQSVIDRRFYRRKYDAAKTLAAFSATVRDEVELDQLTSELLNVVNETMQPTHVSLWLKEFNSKG
jgi:hypothetical protein